MEWALSCTRGLAHLAAIKIIHRDVAARNFLVVHRKGALHPVISDFGLAKMGPQWRTAEDDNISPRWASPELLNPDTQLATYASDLWVSTL